MLEGSIDEVSGGNGGKTATPRFSPKGLVPDRPQLTGSGVSPGVSSFSIWASYEYAGIKISDKNFCFVPYFTNDPTLEYEKILKTAKVINGEYFIVNAGDKKSKSNQKMIFFL